MGQWKKQGKKNIKRQKLEARKKEEQTYNKDTKMKGIKETDEKNKGLKKIERITGSEKNMA